MMSAMERIGNLGAIMSAICLFAALLSAQHDLRNRLMHHNQSSLTEATSSVGSFDTSSATLSNK